MNPPTGRFWTADTFEGSEYDPSSLHAYVYTANNPANDDDPSGLDFGPTTVFAESAFTSIFLIPEFSPSPGVVQGLIARTTSLTKTLQGPGIFVYRGFRKSGTSPSSFRNITDGTGAFSAFEDPPYSDEEIKPQNNWDCRITFAVQSQIPDRKPGSVFALLDPAVSGSAQHDGVPVIGHWNLRLEVVDLASSLSGLAKESKKLGCQ
jgi:hypothetical protein